MKKFEEAQLKVLTFGNEDIIQTSGGPFSLIYGDGSNHTGVDAGSKTFDGLTK